jgi:glycosyltransferase involved in cell wall biosynthesis
MGSLPTQAGGMNSLTAVTQKGPVVGFYSFNDDDALAVIRMLGPAKMAGLELINGVNNREINFEAAKEADLIILQREFAVDYNNYEKLITLARTLNKPVVHDLDDLLIMLPEDHPDRIAGNLSPALLPLLQTIMEADLITVPTSRLRDYLLPYNPSVVIIPNYLDDSLWKIKTPQIRQDPGSPVAIGYMGSYSHAPDLLMILPALLQLVVKYTNRIRFQFWGIEPPQELAPYAKTDWSPPPSYRYSEFTEYFQQQGVDIVIAPLRDTLFNSCKSAIKFLEYGAIGVPGVYSRVPTYTGIIEHENDALLATTTDDWVGMLSRLIESPELRTNLIETAQKKIRNNWLLSKNSDKRLLVYSDLVSNYTKDRKTYPPSFDVVKSLTRQLYEEHVRHTNERQHFYTYVKDKERDIQNLTEYQKPDCCFGERGCNLCSQQELKITACSENHWQMVSGMKRFNWLTIY